MEEVSVPETQNDLISQSMEGLLPSGSHRVINVCVIPMGKGEEPYTMPIVIKGNVTSLKQVFTESTYWKKVFTLTPNTPNNEPPGFSVFRRSIEGNEDPGLHSMTLHVLLLKCEGFKYARNPNAHSVELHCATYFYGPLVIALNDNETPYALHSFSPAQLSVITQLSTKFHKNFPPPFDKNKDKMNSPPEKSLKYTYSIGENIQEELEECKSVMPIELFFMYRFKTSYCPKINSKHDWSQCIYAHNPQDFRRPVDLYYYLPEDCPRICNRRTPEVCSEGENCKYCHSKCERLYHPNRYKTCPCESLKSKRKMCKRGLNCAFFHSKSERREVCKQPYKTEQLGLAKEDGINPTSIFENPNFSFTKGDGVSKHHGGSPWKTQTPMFTLSKDWPKLGELETKNCRESGEITRTSTSRNTSMTSDTSPSLTLTQEEGTLEASGVSGGIVRHRWTVHVSGDKGNRKDRGRSGMEMRGVNTPPGHEYMRRPPVHSQFVPSNNIPNVYGGMGGSMYQRSVANFPAYKINYEANNYYNQGTLGNYLITIRINTPLPQDLEVWVWVPPHPLTKQ